MTIELAQYRFDYFAELRKDWLEKARAVAREVALAEGTVCADDIHRLIPPPKQLDRRIIGQVFNGFRFVRVKRSERAECHHRFISVFEI